MRILIHRFGIAIACITILVLACGCRRTQTTSISAGGPAITADPVGPVPGEPTNVVRRSNPYSNDPVALQDGRRLFNWYNCSGCHGGHAGGGMGPSLRDPDWLYGNRDDQIFDTIAVTTKGGGAEPGAGSKGDHGGGGAAAASGSSVKVVQFCSSSAD